MPLQYYLRLCIHFTCPDIWTCLQLTHYMKPRRLDSSVFGKVQLVSQFSLVHFSGVSFCACGYLFITSVINSTRTPVQSKMWTFSTNTHTVSVFICLEAQVLSQKHGHDLGQVLYSGPVHVLLCVVQRVPELWEGSGNDMKHRDTCMDRRRGKRKVVMMTDSRCYIPTKNTYIS